MRGRAKSGKTIDIVLNEEKFYFPGDSLQGSCYPINYYNKTSFLFEDISFS